MDLNWVLFYCFYLSLIKLINYKYHLIIPVSQNTTQQPLSLSNNIKIIITLSWFLFLRVFLIFIYSLCWSRIIWSLIDFSWFFGVLMMCFLLWLWLLGWPFTWLLGRLLGWLLWRLLRWLLGWLLWWLLGWLWGRLLRRFILNLFRLWLGWLSLFFHFSIDLFFLFLFLFFFLQFF